MCMRQTTLNTNPPTTRNNTKKPNQTKQIQIKITFKKHEIYEKHNR